MTKQITLFDADQTYREIKKHSSMVQMNNITSLQERKALNALMRVAKDMLKREPEKRIFQCGIGMIKRLSGLKDNDNTTLKDALENLSNTAITYNIFGKDNAKEWGVFSVLSMAKIKTEGRGKPTTVSFEFPSLVLEMVKNPNMFVRLNLLALRDLKSKHSIALYEFLKDYINLGKFKCSVGNFRTLMGLQEGQYPIFTMLKKRVLNIAVDEINEKTDITVGYELERRGRKVTYIHFTMSSKAEALPLEEKQDKIRERLTHFGVQTKQIEYLLNHHDEQYLRANINIVEEQAKKGKIKDITAYLLKAFSDDFRPIKTEFTLNQEAEQLEKERKVEEEEQEKIAYEALKKRYYQEKKEKVTHLLQELAEHEIEGLKGSFITNLTANNAMKLVYQSKGFDNPIIQGRWYDFLALDFLASDYHNFENFQASCSETKQSAIE